MIYIDKNVILPFTAMRRKAKLVRKPPPFMVRFENRWTTHISLEEIYFVDKEAGAIHEIFQRIWLSRRGMNECRVMCRTFRLSLI